MTAGSDHDVLARLAGANPIRLAQLETLNLPKPQLPSLPPTSVHKSWRSPLAVVGVVVGLAAAIAAPAIAMSDRLQDLFGLSNSGSPVATTSLSLDQISAIARIGFADGVRKLETRHGIALYVGRTASGALCFATGPADGVNPEFGVLACQGTTPRAFPSPTTPIADFSPMHGQAPSNDVFVSRLIGFAADGVASVAVRDVNGDLHGATVTGNVYVSEPLHPVAATAIVALDNGGSILYTEPLESSTPG
jgi:hypothetical protein